MVGQAATGRDSLAAEGAGPGSQCRSLVGVVLGVWGMPLAVEVVGAVDSSYRGARSEA